MSDRPIRIQLRRTKGWRLPENTVNVARPGRFGNPWYVEMTGTFGAWTVFGPNVPAGGISCGNREGAILLAIKFFRQRVMMGGINKDALRGKNVACWCRLGDPCHGDVLLELANEHPACADSAGPCRVIEDDQEPRVRSCEKVREGGRMSPEEIAILTALSEDGGRQTGQITQRSGAFLRLGKRIASAWVRNQLLYLEKQGFVARLDEEKPVCWIRTGAGTKMLKDCQAPSAKGEE
jgi:hypothetical protein